MNAARSSAIALAGLTFACAPVRRVEPAPHIDRVQPDSVVLMSGSIIEVVVRGSGFVAGSPGRNTVVVAGVQISDVPASADGSEIRLVMPDRAPSTGDAAPLPIEAGHYDLVVKTPAGTSNAVVMRVGR